jgi:hypothetical protein
MPRSKKPADAPNPRPEPKPSEVIDIYWLYAERQVGAYPEANERCGKWLLFIPVAEIDEAWAKIKQATQEGLLGDSAKVATARPNPNATRSDERVICVYTYDWTDVEDVRRIREALRRLGFTCKLPYKADEDTHAGRYQVRGHQRISKYYE